MRISDWSSDVCSSDLIDRRGDLALPTDGPPNRTTITAKVRKQAAMMKVGKVMVGSSDWRAEDGGRGSPRPPSCLFGGFLRHQIAVADQLAELRAAALDQIGRAACRDRVC